MNMEQKENTKKIFLGPPRFDNVKLIISTLLTFLAGILGSIFVFFTVFASNFFARSETSNPIILVLIILGSLFTTLIINLLAVFFLNISLKKNLKTNFKTKLNQIFLINLFIFLGLIPVYILAQFISFETVLYILIIHICISILFTSIVSVILDFSKYLFVDLYGYFIGNIIAFMLLLLLIVSLQRYNEVYTILLFVSAPFMWGFIQFVNGIFKMVYRWTYDTYGKDVLNLENFRNEA